MVETKAIRIVPVALEDKKLIKQFIKFHYSIYDGDENWVAPLIFDYLERLNPKKNPYFHHSAVQPFLAYRDGRIVGRITAHENNNHVEYQKEKVGFFGFFECIDDQAVADALFGAASVWLSERDLETMRGPASFSVNGDPVALLIDGFDSPAVIGTSYNPEYYEGLVDKAGFAKAQDYYAYHFDLAEKAFDKFKRLADRALKDPRLTVRSADMKNFPQEVENLKFLYNDALANNWGAVPMNDEEFEHFSGELKLAVDPEMTLIAEYDGKPIGLSLVFKDMNQAMKPAKGRLLPVGLFKILYMRNKCTRIRIPVLGVVEAFRNRGIDIIFYVKSMELGFRKGYRDAELSWILESNTMMNTILERLGMHLYKTYRIYDRPIG